jgi:hypothetical protein
MNFIKNVNPSGGLGYVENAFDIHSILSSALPVKYFLHKNYAFRVPGVINRAR